MHPTSSVEAVLANVVSLVAAGMGVAFFVADWRSRSSRVLAAFLVGMGLSLWTTAAFHFYRDLDSLPLWVKLSGIPVSLTAIAGAEWLLRIRRTIPAANLNTRFGDILVRCAQGSALVYGVLTLVFWRDRAEWIMFRLGSAEILRQPRFLIFALPFFVAGAPIGLGGLLTAQPQPPLPQERRPIALLVPLALLASDLL